MSELIENVLDFARGRLGGGFMTTRDGEKPLEPVLLQIIDEFRGVHPERDVVVDIDLRESVECDRQRIGQFLSNLLGNAFIYDAPNAPVQVRAHGGWRPVRAFRHQLWSGDRALCPERLSSRFFGAACATTEEGLGLGLYICSEIAKAHGGTIDVKSESGTTCFALRDARASMTECTKYNWIVTRRLKHQDARGSEFWIYKP